MKPAEMTSTSTSTTCLSTSDVQRHQHQIKHRNLRKGPIEAYRDGESGYKEHGGRCCGDRYGHRACGDWTTRFQRMMAIGVAIDDVVDQIDSAREQAEHDERDRGRPERGVVEKLSAEDHAGEDEDVLGPLPRTQRDDEVEHAA